MLEEATDAKEQNNKEPFRMGDRLQRPIVAHKGVYLYSQSEFIVLMH